MRNGMYFLSVVGFVVLVLYFLLGHVSPGIHHDPVIPGVQVGDKICLRGHGLFEGMYAPELFLVCGEVTEDVRGDAPKPPPPSGYPDPSGSPL